MKFEYPLGATPLDEDEAQDLIPHHITLQSQLNEWEQLNILDAEQWAFSKKHSKIFEINFCKKLHLKMFGNTWKWAGKFRKTNKNIGIAWSEINQSLLKLFEDVKVQLAFKSYPDDEIAVRFHHRLVCIHPFPNGNGRHSRLMTDLLLTSIKSEKFSWGNGFLNEDGDARSAYINALRAADKKDMHALLKFVRS